MTRGPVIFLTEGGVRIPRFYFNTAAAERYGVNEAIFIQNIYWWVSRNREQGRHYHDGRYWTFNTMKSFAQIFPFWSERQIRRLIQKLTENGVLLKGNFNPSAYDRTLWYSLSDEALALLDESGGPICRNGQMEPPERSIPFAETGAPIPDRNTDRNTDDTHHLSSWGGEEPEGDTCALVKENIEYDVLVLKYNREKIDELVSLITDVVEGTSEEIRIGQQLYTHHAVKKRLLSLDSGHIEYVLDCLAENKTQIRNMRAYLLAMLFNAPTTLDAYYTARVSADWQ